jgi:hypothetical protein
MMGANAQEVTLESLDVLMEFRTYLDSLSTNLRITDEVMLKTIIPSIVLPQVAEEEKKSGTEETEAGRQFMGLLTGYMMGFSNMPMIEVSGPPVLMWIHKGGETKRGIQCFARIWGRKLPKIIDNPIDVSELEKLSKYGCSPTYVPQKVLIGGKIYKIEDLSNNIEMQALLDRKEEIIDGFEILLCGGKGNMDYYLKDNKRGIRDQLCIFKQGQIEVDCTIDDIFHDIPLRKIEYPELADYVIGFEMDFYGIKNIGKKMKSKISKEFLSNPDFQGFVLKEPGTPLFVVKCEDGTDPTSYYQ